MDESQESRRLINFIIGLQEDTVVDLLRDPGTCRTFIRLLSPLAQHMLSRLLMLPTPIDLSHIRSWAPMDREKQSKHEEAFGQLYDCHFLSITETEQGTYRAMLRDEIRQILLGRHVEERREARESEKYGAFSEVKSSSIFATERKVGLTTLANVPYVKEEVLDDWAASQLEKILLWMMQLTTKIDPDIKQLLADAKLVNFDNSLTKDGHQFVLADPRAQIWRIVKSYLESFERESDQNLIAALRFVLKLGSLQFTRGYQIADLSPAQQQLLKPFNALGLLYYGHPDLPSGYFFPTRVVLNFFGKGDLFRTDGWILIDTNFKITAYTSNRLHVALLRKFTLITYEMPGFTSAYISADSFHKALEAGASMHDILNFLKLNLSSLGDGVIPPVVEHQFHVWEEQRNRLKVTPNSICRQYTSEEQARRAMEMAGEMYGFIGYFPVGSSIFVITKKDIEPEYGNRLLKESAPVRDQD